MIDNYNKYHNPLGYSDFVLKKMGCQMILIKLNLKLILILILNLILYLLVNSEYLIMILILDFNNY